MIKYLEAIGWISFGLALLGTIIAGNIELGLLGFAVMFFAAYNKEDEHDG